MINTTDFQEIEVLLPGDWRRADNGDIYSFTVEKMELNDERLFKQLLIRHLPPSVDPPGVTPVETSRWALTIKDDFCGIIVGDDEYIIREIESRGNGGASMVWEDAAGPGIIRFSR